MVFLHELVGYQCSFAVSRQEIEVVVVVDGREIVAKPRYIREFSGGYSLHLSLTPEVSAYLDDDIARQNAGSGFDAGKIFVHVKRRFENQGFGRSAVFIASAEETEKVIGIAGGW